MNCPKCLAPMERVQVGDVEVDRCTGCRGVWFDSLEEERLKAAGAGAAVDIGDEAEGRRHNEHRRIDCPRCHTRLIRMVDVEQPQIWFEACKFCYGRFFDAGEFRHLADDGVSTLMARWRAAGPPPMA
jgi:Zn-finger nucleic acid-binding protein